MKYKKLIIHSVICSILFGPFVQTHAKKDFYLPNAMLAAATKFNAASDKREFLSNLFGKSYPAEQKFLQSELIQLKGVTFSDVILSSDDTFLIPAGEKNIKFQVVDLEKGNFNLNGLPLHLNFKESLEKNYRLIEKTINETLQAKSIMSFLIPEAHAFVFLVAAGVLAVGGLGYLLKKDIDEATAPAWAAEKLFPCQEKVEFLKREGIVASEATPFPSEEIKNKCVKADPDSSKYLDGECSFELNFRHCIDELSSLYNPAKIKKGPSSALAKRLNEIGGYIVTNKSQRPAGIPEDAQPAAQ